MLKSLTTNRWFAVIVLLAIFTGCFTLNSNAQCKRFTEKNCLPMLTPFQNNGQINTTTLFEGDSASLNMTFYSLLEYRLLVCAHPVLGDGVYFRVKDSDGEVLYTNKDNPSLKYWDFKVNSTQDLHIDVMVPENPESMSDMPPSGCVSILLGFKE